jgi:GMP synthase (glutamine-hydrolysing)
VRIYVVDNGGQWTHREWRVLKYLDVETKIVPNTTPLADLEAEGVDGLVLSGGAPRVGLDAKAMGRNAEYLDKADVPILGICAGHQFMALHLGGKAAPAKTPEFGKAQIVVDREDELFAHLPNTFQVWVSHNDEVTAVPDDFVVLAHSDDCAVQAMRSLTRPFFGVQFHPEVEHTEHGYDIFRNFAKACEGRR